MSEIPERIWIGLDMHGYISEGPPSDLYDIEYIREDVHQARIAELQAEIKAYKRAEEAPRKGALIDVISDEDWLYDEPDTWKIEVGQLKNDLV